MKVKCNWKSARAVSLGRCRKEKETKSKGGNGNLARGLPTGHMGVFSVASFVGELQWQGENQIAISV
jgi:hypothetical protein